MCSDIVYHLLEPEDKKHKLSLSNLGYKEYKEKYMAKEVGKIVEENGIKYMQTNAIYTKGALCFDIKL